MQLLPPKLGVGDDGVDGGSKREVLVGGGLEHRINVRAISSGDFTAMGVADEFTNDALEDATYSFDCFYMLLNRIYKKTYTRFTCAYLRYYIFN